VANRALPPLDRRLARSDELGLHATPSRGRDDRLLDELEQSNTPKQRLVMAAHGQSVRCVISMIKYEFFPPAGVRMSTIERMTITIPADMAAGVKAAVEAGDYASTSEVVRDALRDWKLRRAVQLQEMEALKADIDRGLADVATGRVKAFDVQRIVERGRKLLANR
jgi:antitoxin ParD1/3/4